MPKAEPSKCSSPARARASRCAGWRCCRGAGIGGAILRDTLALARERGKPVTIHVEKFNPARRLYMRLGFGIVADHGVYDLMRAEPQ
jgi:predicted GNAT family acetyltransferase